jgi:HAD superfamily hydrolase (TIGR01458 family)
LGWRSDCRLRIMSVRGLLLDIEGTLVGDKRYQPVAGAVEFVRTCRERGLPLRLITNNTTDTRPRLIEKLARAGFDFTIDELHTCVAAAVGHLRASGAARCLVLGSADLRQMFADEGFSVLADSAVDAVIVGLDTGLTYERLRLACDAVSGHSAALLALHRNRVYTDSQGRCSPSVGAIVEAISYATQVEPIVIGKPSPDYFRQALADLAVPAGEVLVVSDDPFSDLAGAKRMGMQAAFVLSGKYRERSVLDRIPAAEQPGVVVDAIGDLLTEPTLTFERPTTTGGRSSR